MLAKLPMFTTLVTSCNDHNNLWSACGPWLGSGNIFRIFIWLSTTLILTHMIWKSIYYHSHVLLFLSAKGLSIEKSIPLNRPAYLDLPDFFSVCFPCRRVVWCGAGVDPGIFKGATDWNMKCTEGSPRSSKRTFAVRLESKIWVWSRFWGLEGEAFRNSRNIIH